MRKKHFQTLVTVFIILLLPGTLIQGQTPDTQWYVMDGKGLNHDTYVDLIGSDRINISGVTPANKGITRNDIFIIYKNGKFYSNRWSERINLPPFDKTLSSLFEGTNLDVITNPHPDTIQFLYWTNVYDVDDPVGEVVVSNSVGRTTPYEVEPRAIDNIFAHQDIVAGKDVVIAFNNIDIQYIKYNKVDQNHENILELNRLFNIERSFFNNVEIMDDTLLRVINGGVSEYIVFRVSDDLDPSLIGQYHTWIFYDEHWNVIDTLKEEIRMAHDPNYVHLTSVCKDGTDYFAFYEVHFLNEGDAAAVSVGLTFKPNRFFKRGRNSEFNSLGGEFGGPYECEDLLEVPLGRCIFNRRRDIKLIKEDANLLGDIRTEDEIQLGRPFYDESKGYFRFCVKLKEPPSEDNYYEEMASEELRLIDPEVFFGDIPEPILVFKPSSEKNKINKINIDEKCPNRNCDGLTQSMDH